MISQWLIREQPNNAHKKCIIGLPGRGNSAEMMIGVLRDFCLPDTLIVSVQTDRYAWYPQPHSVDEQSAAVSGLPTARAAINRVVTTIRNGWGLRNIDIALVGYSAGAVVALDVATRKIKPFAGVVSMCGAILEPDNVRPARNESTPIMLVHNQDDRCFDWWERYLPMRLSLTERGYDVERCENRFGGHMINLMNVIDSANFLGRCFEFHDWEHPRLSHWELEENE